MKGGRVIGSSDDFGLRAQNGEKDVHDVHATILRLMGMDHTRLTYLYQGRDQRLTDVHGGSEFTDTRCAADTSTYPYLHCGSIKGSWLSNA